MRLNMKERRCQALHNMAQSVVLISAMIGVLALVAWLLSGSLGVVTVIGIGLLLAVVGPRVAPSLVLRYNGAREVPAYSLIQVRRLLAELTRRAELRSVPRLYYMPSSVPNAFAVGRRESVVIAVSEGLLRILDMRELAGVLAHEVAHVRNDDLRVMHLADVIGRTTRALSTAGAFILFLTVPFWLLGGSSLPLFPALILMSAPVLGDLLQLALSRTREFEADLDAAELTGDPQGLALALSKLERANRGFWSLFLPNLSSHEPSLLRSHPDTTERIRRLEELVLPTRDHGGYQRGVRKPVQRRPDLPVVIARPRSYVHA